MLKVHHASLISNFRLFIATAVFLLISSFAVSARSIENQQSQRNVESAALFAGGCFWCMEPPFEKLKGVYRVISGYAGGKKIKPTYAEVSAGKTAYTEAVKIYFDPEVISYDNLLQVFWRNIDPTDNQGQFVDRGKQYRPEIFVFSKEQKKLAEQSRKALKATGRFKKIVVDITNNTTFYPAEKYHQDYYKKNPIRYKFYRYRSGRDQFLNKTWGKEREYTPDYRMKADDYVKPSDKTLRKRLSPLSYDVTQHGATEPAFKNKYWNNKQQGIYVDIISGRPLFSSTDKFSSGTGWPSFSKPISTAVLRERQDYTLLLPRTEVMATLSGSHLGHVFSDGPLPTGLRYCINSSALRFVPLKDLNKEGYGKYTFLFEK